MKKLGFIAFLLLVFASCVPDIDRVEEPDNLIERDKMVLVMTDLVKTESHIINEYPRLPDYFKAMVKSGDVVLKEHKVSREDFENSMDYYASRQEEMIEIYDEVLNNLSKELGEIQTELQEENK